MPLSLIHASRHANPTAQAGSHSAPGATTTAQNLSAIANTGSTLPDADGGLHDRTLIEGVIRNMERLQATAMIQRMNMILDGDTNFTMPGDAEMTTLTDLKNHKMRSGDVWVEVMREFRPWEEEQQLDIQKIRTGYDTRRAVAVRDKSLIIDELTEAEIKTLENWIKKYGVFHNFIHLVEFRPTEEGHGHMDLFVFNIPRNNEERAVIERIEAAIHEAFSTGEHPGNSIPLICHARGVGCLHVNPRADGAKALRSSALQREPLDRSQRNKQVMSEAVDTLWKWAGELNPGIQFAPLSTAQRKKILHFMGGYSEGFFEFTPQLRSIGEARGHIDLYLNHFPDDAQGEAQTQALYKFTDEVHNWTLDGGDPLGQKMKDCGMPFLHINPRPMINAGSSNSASADGSLTRFEIDTQTVAPRKAVVKLPLSTKTHPLIVAPAPQQPSPTNTITVSKLFKEQCEVLTQDCKLKLKTIYEHLENGPPMRALKGDTAFFDLMIDRGRQRGPWRVFAKFMHIAGKPAYHILGILDEHGSRTVAWNGGNINDAWVTATDNP